MTHYVFTSSYLYLEEWNDTLSLSKESIKAIISEKNNADPFNEYELKENNLIVKNYDSERERINIEEIRNIDKYSIHCIFSDLIEKKKNNNLL